jgi:hypothetical protein
MKDASWAEDERRRAEGLVDKLISAVNHKLRPVYVMELREQVVDEMLYTGG